MPGALRAREIHFPWRSQSTEFRRPRQTGRSIGEPCWDATCCKVAQTRPALASASLHVRDAIVGDRSPAVASILGAGDLTAVRPTLRLGPPIEVNSVVPNHQRSDRAPDEVDLRTHGRIVLHRAGKTRDELLNASRVEG